MDEDKTLLKKDLALILKLNSKLHYDDIAKIQKIRDEIIQHNLLTTSLGKRYLKKLEQILQETNAYSCLFCGTQTTSESIICKDCLSKLQRPAAKENDEPKKNNTPTESIASVKKVNSVNNIESKLVTDNKESKKNNKKTIIIGAAILIAVIAIISVIGLNTIFTIIMLISLGVLIYKCVKKKPKRNAIIVFAVFLILTGITGGFESGADDDVLSYLGTPQKKVFQDYDQSNFYTKQNALTNDGMAENGMAGITLENGEVSAVELASGMNASYNVAGVHIGDDFSVVEKAMKKKKAVRGAYTAGSIAIYYFKDNGNNIRVVFFMTDNMIDLIICSYDSNNEAAKYGL
jgi:energy-coupling factor transporter transmembrane protein EcfT